GLLIRIGKGDAPPSWAAEVLAGRDRRLSAATAPPHGLYLWDVRYPDAFRLPRSPENRFREDGSAPGNAIIPPGSPA
ncbi:MAG: hypothetical protein ACRES1_04160, partial [Steroidobacteraceae bacterium]